jgi:hypothetical protein
VIVVPLVTFPISEKKRKLFAVYGISFRELQYQSRNPEHVRVRKNLKP